MSGLLWKFCNKPKWLAVAVAADIAGCGLLLRSLKARDPSPPHGWAVVTGSTTGYGDFYPKTTAGRAGAVWLMASMWFLSLVAGAQLTARMVAEPDCFMDEEQRQIQRDLSELRADVKALLEGSS